MNNGSMHEAVKWIYKNPIVTSSVHGFNSVLNEMGLTNTSDKQNIMEVKSCNIVQMLGKNIYLFKIAGLLGASAVILGAYGAHVVSHKANPEEARNFETANRYHFFHTFALFGVPFCRFPKVTGALFISGILIFCGTCYYNGLTADKTYNRFTPTGEGSNACTIIALLMATNVHTSNIRIKCLFKSPTREYLAELFSDAILKGNTIHHDLFKGSSLSQDTNLTLPEAMDASKSSLGTLTEWKSSVYFNDIKKYLYKEMNHNITDWYTNPPCCQSNNLYMVLIAHNKAILFIMQLDMKCVLLVDSHQHSTYGALMCQVQIEKLENLCLWYSNMLCDSVGSKPYAYELSFLYFKCEKNNNKISS